MWNTLLLSRPRVYRTRHNEMVQHNAVRFIFRLKGRYNITSGLESLDLETLAARRRKTRHFLLLKLLANEENHNSLINAYEDLINTRPTNMPTTRAAARGDPPPTIYAKTPAYHNSLLPRTVRELRSNLNKVSVN